MKPFPVLSTQRLVLRDLKAGDRADIFSVYSNPEVTRCCDMVTLTDPVQAGEIIRVLQADWEKDAGARWAITRHGSPGVIGICGLGWHRHNFSALLSYDLHRQFWNQGIMTEAVRAVVGYAFGQAWLNRITAITVLDNPGSVRVLRHIGFQEEGILRAWGFWKGDFKDVRCFSLLRKDVAVARGPALNLNLSRLGTCAATPSGAGFAGPTVPDRLRGCRDTATVHAPPASRASSAVAVHPEG
jgi:ribosomal-protein-alanine N-acetyltransferase